jgi:hypothetical protein
MGVQSGPSEEEIALQVAQMEVFWNVSAADRTVSQAPSVDFVHPVYQGHPNEPRRIAYRPHSSYAVFGPRIR